MSAQPASKRELQEVMLGTRRDHRVFVRVSPACFELFNTNHDFVQAWYVPPLPAAESQKSVDPLAAAEQSQREHAAKYAPHSRDPGIDALAVCAHELERLSDNERAAVLCYLTSRFAPPPPAAE